MNTNHAKVNEIDLNSNNTNSNYEINEQQISVQNENIENGSITKKSALQFFKNVIEDNKSEKFNNTNILSSAETFKTVYPVENYNNLNNPVSIDTYNTEKNVSNSSFKHFNNSEVILEPGPPPTFDYMPRTQSVKKDQMTERLKKLSTSQKLLSPEQIPSGAIRIFPDMTSEIKQEIVEQSCEKKEMTKSGLFDDNLKQKHLINSYKSVQHSEPHTPMLRPQADIDVRPGSPRPSAEAISMQKLWSKAHNQHVQKTPVSISPVQTKTYSSSEMQSFVSETITKNGELLKNESREEKQGSLKIDDGIKKISESFSEISFSPTKHVEPPHNEIMRPASANIIKEVMSKDSFTDNQIQTKNYSEDFKNFKLNSSFDTQPNASESIERTNSFIVKSDRKLNSSHSFDKNISKTSYFGPDSSVSPIKHVESPKKDKTISNFTRSFSEEIAKDNQWKSQSPNIFKGHNQNKTYSSFETHSSFSKRLEKDGILVMSENKEEGGRIVDNGEKKIYDSFSERSKSPLKNIDLSKNCNKSNSIKTMQKMFEQTGTSSIVSNTPLHVRPYNRIKSRASDSDFESEAELSKYNVEQKLSENYGSFESKIYSSNSQIQEKKNTSMIMQSPVKESGYIADTDEPRGLQGDSITNQQTFSSKRNPGFQSALIKKV